MPTEHQVGEPGPANDLIGGVPIVHYLDFLSKGRGQVIRLLFIDSEIAFKDVRYTFDEYPRDIRPKFIAKGGMNPAGSVPVVELNGKIFTQSYAIIRHFSRVLGNKYDGDTEDERYHVDKLCDIAIDWTTAFVNAFFSPNRAEEYPKYQEGRRVRYLDGLERHLVESDLSQRGPFVVGQKFTYADIVIFQILHDEELGKGDQSGLKGYPRLKELYNAVTTRPNVRAFLDSTEYKG